MGAQLRELGLLKGQLKERLYDMEKTIHNLNKLLCMDWDNSPIEIKDDEASPSEQGLEDSKEDSEEETRGRKKRKARVQGGSVSARRRK